MIETAGKRPLAMTTAARLEVPVAISFQATRRVPGRASSRQRTHPLIPSNFNKLTKTGVVDPGSGSSNSSIRACTRARA